MSGDDGDFGVTRPPEPRALGGPTRGAQPGPTGYAREDAGERAIVHHFGCQRRPPLRSALVPGAVNYLCDECGARVSVGADWQPIGPKVPANKPMTDQARRSLSKLPAILADLKGYRVTKSAIATRLGIDRKTLDAWIANRWLTWPPTG